MSRLLLALLISGCDPAEAELDRLSARSQKDCGGLILRSCSTAVSETSECFAAELQAGRDATFTLTRFTVEGDPIVTSVFTGGTSAVTVFIDDRADGYGARRVRLKHCASAILGPDATGCPALLAQCDPES